MPEPRKDTMLPSFYKSISILYTISKLYLNILLSRVLEELNESGLLSDEQSGFQLMLGTTLQLDRLVERVNRNLDETRLSCAIFLDVAKAFDTVLVEGLLYRFTVLNFSSQLVKTISSYVQNRTFQATFQSATSTCCGMWADVAQGGIVSPVLFSLYVNDMPVPYRQSTRTTRISWPRPIAPSFS
jgi:hypothetical protein